MFRNEVSNITPDQIAEKKRFMRQGCDTRLEVGTMADAAASR